MIATVQSGDGTVTLSDFLRNWSCCSCQHSIQLRLCRHHVLALKAVYPNLSRQQFGDQLLQMAGRKFGAEHSCHRGLGGMQPLSRKLDDIQLAATKYATPVEQAVHVHQDIQATLAATLPGNSVMALARANLAQLQQSLPIECRPTQDQALQNMREGQIFSLQSHAQAVVPCQPLSGLQPPPAVASPQQLLTCDDYSGKSDGHIQQCSSIEPALEMMPIQQSGASVSNEHRMLQASGSAQAGKLDQHGAVMVIDAALQPMLSSREPPQVPDSQVQASSKPATITPSKRSALSGGSDLKVELETVLEDMCHPGLPAMQRRYIFASLQQGLRRAAEKIQQHRDRSGPPDISIVEQFESRVGHEYRPYYSPGRHKSAAEGSSTVAKAKALMVAQLTVGQGNNLQPTAIKKKHDSNKKPRTLAGRSEKIHDKLAAGSKNKENQNGTAE